MGTIARTFDGVDDFVGFTPRTWETWAGITVAAVARRNATGVYHTFYYAGASGGSVDGNIQMGVNDGNDLYFANTSFAGTVPTTVALYAATKATGTVAPRAHYSAYPLTTWVHNAMGATVANPSTTASTIEQVGQWNGSADPWNGDIEWLGIWNFEMTDNQVEALGRIHPARLPHLYPGCQRFWWFNQPITDTVRDLTNHISDQTARTGTTHTNLTILAPNIGGAPGPYIPGLSAVG